MPKPRRTPSIFTGPKCDYCGHPAELKWSTDVYGPAHDYGWVWYCHSCQAWVGCHKHTTEPLGRLANRELRQWKKAAHAAFDPAWKGLEVRGVPNARGVCYRALAELMCMNPKDCHIGMLTPEKCRFVVDLCNSGALYGALLEKGVYSRVSTGGSCGSP